MVSRIAPDGGGKGCSSAAVPVGTAFEWDQSPQSQPADLSKDDGVCTRLVVCWVKHASYSRPRGVNCNIAFLLLRTTQALSQVHGVYGVPGALQWLIFGLVLRGGVVLRGPTVRCAQI